VKPPIASGGLYSVSMSARAGWAIGATPSRNRNTTHPVILHFAGGRWMKIRTSLGAGDVLSDVFATGANDAWVVGGHSAMVERGPTPALIEQ